MLTLEVTAGSLAATRFAYSPLAEVVSSARVLLAERPPPMLARWVAETRGRLGADDLRLLAAAFPAPPSHFAPLLCFDHEPDPSASPERGLERLRAQPAAVVRHDLLQAWRPHTVPAATRRLAGTPDVAHRFADLLWRYWEVAVAPYWERMRLAVHDEVAHRSWAVARGGVGALFHDLHPTVRLDGRLLRVAKPYLHDTVTDGPPRLVPSVFVWPRIAVVHDRAGRFDLHFPVRGVGRVWEDQGAAGSGDRLADLLGRGRAAVLAGLDLPRTTTQLSACLRLGPSTVSQHLGVLRRSGLVSPDRRGREVYYRRTALGDSVVEA